MAHSSELATESVDSVKFSFLTTEDVRKHSYKQITEVQLFDNLDKPIPGGLYDPNLGPVLERNICKTCGQRSHQCHGHFGHIELTLPIYSPLLFNILLGILRKSCFNCHCFMEEQEQVEKLVYKLELIILKGDIVGAKSADYVLQSDWLSLHETGASDVEDANVSGGSQAHHDDSTCMTGQNWTSLQYGHAMSLLDEFTKRKSKKCARCGFEPPKISHPTFGWIYLTASGSTIRRNVIRGSKLDKSFIDEAEQDSDDMQSSEAVYDGISDSSAKAKKDRVENLPPEFLKQKKLFSGPLLPSEVKNHLKLLWKNETQLCSLICDIHGERLCMSGKKRSYYMFFIEALLVPPIKFRPITMGGDSVTNHPQTVLLAKVLQSNIDLLNAHKSDPSKVVTRWLDLQQSVNVLYGNKKSIGERDNIGNGICQLLEKKEGVFRQKMMGKRVNFSCRSVLSPDPYLAVNEIGIPPCFALKLTYPERMTRWNVDKLRRSIINGPDVHPGATHYSENSSSQVKLPQSRKMRVSISRKLASSKGIVTQLGKSVEHEHEGKVVYRHLQDGDIVLVNRQPTLHKPSIMAHVVRVLSGEKTLRMHYANCSTYNADFDGDEMNVHFPQDEISRAEAFHIVNANHQYIIPTSGDTKRGLIQDHIIAAVLLTKKDTFLSREDCTHLLYSSGVSAAARCSFVDKSCQKVSTLLEDAIELVVPAILKPKPLWTGKQVITSLLNHMTKSKGLPPFTFEEKCKIDNKFLTSQSSYDNPQLCTEKSADPQLSIEESDGIQLSIEESDDPELPIQKDDGPKIPIKKSEDLPFQIHENDFLNGVIDKAQFGKYGLIHTVQELYGSNTAGLLLSSLSRLFTVFLQLHGFTCGIDDLLLKQNIDVERRRKLEDANKINKKVYSSFIDAEDEYKSKHSEEVDAESIDAKDENAEQMKLLQAGIEKKVRIHGDSAITNLDKLMTNHANTLLNEVNSIIFPNNSKDRLANKSADNSEEIGLLKAFPKNCFFLMTTSGAKGSEQNFSQVSSLLGQQSLEGKRVPLMISGKTLPCFPPWDPALRAGGFITDCFLTGLRPQEYYFHCMAGREGLVDTAVKTSRSGYLQRCLVKNLECLKVGYDLTVRDADGSIVQFCYGEDGVDVHKTSFISKFDTIASNQRVVLKRLRDHSEDAQAMRFENFTELYEKLKNKVDDVITSRLGKLQTPLDIVREKNESSLEKTQQKDLMNLTMLNSLSSLAQSIAEPDRQENKSSLETMLPKVFMNLMMLKYLSSLAQPGEPVGVIAAQSVGEPSTQMTLNTFHHAGQKDSNVTLGIPRLQEILMRASEKIKTPVMSCPLRSGREKEDAERLAETLRKVSVADIVESMDISVVPFSVQKHEVSTIYKLKMKLYSLERYPPNWGVKELEDSVEILKFVFLPELERAIQSHLNMLSKISGIKNLVQKAESDHSEETDAADPGCKSKEKGEENNGIDDDDEDEAEDLGTDAQKRRQQSTDEMEYEDGIENQNVEGEPSGFESEIDQAEPEEDTGSDGEARTLDAEGESRLGPVSKPKSSVKKSKSEAKGKMANTFRKQKDTDKAIHCEFDPDKLEFEVHFRFTNEPHVLLSQIAQRAAKNVYIKKKARIDRCTVSHNTKKKNKPPKIHTEGVDFHSLWDMQDDLDVNKIKSNDIHAILQTYGVEAARATIVKELRKIFKTHGIATDFRHLSLIADFMTQSGKYRPMSRHGMADSVSPFSKMSYETASTFIVNAAYHGEVDNLESPSARICLGLPVKMGTGSFDLMQKVQLNRP